MSHWGIRNNNFFFSGFVHADPHPGNLFVRRDANDRTQLVIIDHGLYESIPDETRTALSGVWRAVVENDYPAMKKYCRLLKVEDYRLFCMALTQRYIKQLEGEKDLLTEFLDANGPKNFNRKVFNALPEEQKTEIRQCIVDFHDRMFDVFQKIPSHLFLIFRNLNTIRSIIKDHGTGVDRYRIMARSAAQGLYYNKSDSSSHNREASQSTIIYVRRQWGKFAYDFRLMADAVQMFFMDMTFRIIKFFGYGPELSL